MKNNDTMRTAITFKSHIINNYVVAEYQRLKRECDEFADVWFLYHSEENATLPDNLASKAFVFNSTQVKEQMYTFKNFWWDACYPSLLFYLKNQNYNYYWCIEYDVRYTGSWKDFFSSYNKCSSDFLALRLMTKDQDPCWDSWQFNNLNCPNEKMLIKCLFAVARFSKRALQKLDESFKHGAHGYCEVMIPSLLSMNNLTIADLNDATDNGRLVYSEDTIVYWTSFWQSKRHMLYHPVYGFWTKRGFRHFSYWLRMRLGLLGVKKYLKNLKA